MEEAGKRFIAAVESPEVGFKAYETLMGGPGVSVEYDRQERTGS